MILLFSRIYNLEQAVVMVQARVADRIAASPVPSVWRIYCQACSLCWFPAALKGGAR